MLITEVSKQKKRNDRVSVYIDGKFAFGMSEEDVLFYHIKEGVQIDDKRYNYIMEEVVFAKARDKALKLLSYNARTEEELVKRLSEDYGAETIARVIELLKRYKYIDDEAYARDYIASSFKLKGWGSKKIEQELRRKGIDEDTAANALENADLDEEERATELLKKRLGGNTSPGFKEKGKHYRYLLGRGFSYDAVTAAFQRLSLTNEED